MKKSVVGILAHVDAGKTTLAEALLFKAGKIRKLGRVDNGDTALDTHSLEKERGITILSKKVAIHKNICYNWDNVLHVYARECTCLHKNTRRNKYAQETFNSSLLRHSRARSSPLT